MNGKIFVKPNKGLQVLNFQRRDHRPLAEEGEWVDEDPQWLRYQRDGDVIIGPPQKQKKSE